MEEMSADQAMETEVTPGETLATFASQGTKPHSSGTEGTFDSTEPSGEPDLQDELDQEVENEKISHINRGFDVSGYSTSHSGRSGSRARSSGT